MKKKLGLDYSKFWRQSKARNQTNLKLVPDQTEDQPILSSNKLQKKKTSQYQAYLVSFLKLFYSYRLSELDRNYLQHAVDQGLVKR